MSEEQMRVRAPARRFWRLRASGTPGANAGVSTTLQTRVAAPPSALFAYASCVVLLLFPLVLKLIKIVHVTRDTLFISDVARVLCADIALGCGALAVSGALVYALQRLRRGVVAGMLVATLGALLLLELTALEHQTWARSSSLLDWKVLWYTVEHYRELRPVIAAETSVSGVLLLAGAALLASVPWLLDWFARRRGLQLRARAAVTWTAALAALVSAGLGRVPPRASELWPLSQSAALGLIAGAFGAAERRVTRAPGAFKPPERGTALRRINAELAAANLTQASGGRPKNVLLVVLESTRFDATTPYTPRLLTTPRLAELARHGALVRRAYAEVPHTSKALVSIMCGYSPHFSVQVTETEPEGLDRPCLPHLLGQLGYRSAFFQAAVGTFEDRPQFALNAGFDSTFTRESYDETGFDRVNYLSVEDKVMVKPLLGYLDRDRSKPFFVTVLTCITHHSYGLPSRYPLEQYAREPTLQEARMPRPWADYNRYLNTVAYADQMLGELIDGLRARDLLDDTLIVVVGDHGQGFDEHGQRAHNTVIWDEGLHVPLVFANPRAFPEPRVIEGVRSQLDIAPTILSLLGVSFPAPLFEGNDALNGPPHPFVYSTCWYDQRCRAETQERYRVIDHFDRQPAEVYDLLADPAERHDLMQSESAREQARGQKLATQALTRMRARQQDNERRFARADAAPGAAPDYVLTRLPEPAHPLHARLNDFVELLGYDAKTESVTPNGFWDAVVYFKCLKPSPLGWRLFGVLETADGREEQTDHHPANGRLFLHECRPGTIVADVIHVWIPSDFPAGRLRYWWGSVFLKQLGHAGGENARLERAEVTPLERGLLVNDGGILLAKLDVKPEYSPELAQLLKDSVHTAAPQIDNPLNVRFGSNLVLLEVRVAPKRVRRLSSLRVTSVWRVEGEQDGPWQIGIGVDSHDERKTTLRMHTPVDGLLPIADWRAGTFVVDTDSVLVLPKIPTGEATLWLTVRTNDERMRVHDDGRAEVKRNRVKIGTIEVTE